MMAATIAVQSQRYEPTGPGPSIIDIDCMSSTLAVQPASVSAVSAAGRRSVCGTLTRSWLAPGSHATITANSSNLSNDMVASSERAYVALNGPVGGPKTRRVKNEQQPHPPRCS